MLLITIILLVVLFYWRLFVVKALNLLVTVFWVVFPDLGSFIPIGLGVRGGKEWPRWGPGLYNFFHTFLVWIPVFALWSLLSIARTKTPPITRNMRPTWKSMPSS